MQLVAHLHSGLVRQLSVLDRSQGRHIIFKKCNSGIICSEICYSNSTQEMVRGFEGDYRFTPSPESPAFSPITPVRYVKILCAMFRHYI